MQNSFHDSFRPVPVQGHAVWIVQCTGNLREVDGPSTTWITMVPMPGIFGRHHFFWNDIWRFTGQSDANF